MFNLHFFKTKKDFSLPEFLYSPIKLKEIQLLRLPTTENILENGCFLLEDKSFDNWPLICDSSRRSIDWLKTLYNTKTLFILRLSVSIILLKAMVKECTMNLPFMISLPFI